MRAVVVGAVIAIPTLNLAAVHWGAAVLALAILVGAMGRVSSSRAVTPDDLVNHVRQWGL